MYVAIKIVEPSDAEMYRWLKANIRAGNELPGSFYLDAEDTSSWDRTIREAMKYEWEDDGFDDDDDDDDYEDEDEDDEAADKYGIPELNQEILDAADELSTALNELMPVIQKTSAAASDAQDAAMAAEYRAWIEYYHQGRDYDAFLAERVFPALKSE